MARSTRTAASTVATIITQDNMIATYLDNCDSLSATTSTVEQGAYALLKDVVTYDALVKVRDAVKGAYCARREPGVDPEKFSKAVKDAANMLWSRTVARAKKASGIKTAKTAQTPEVTNWVPPVAPQSDEAKEKQAKREVAKQEKRDKAYKAAIAAGASEKVAQALADQTVDARKQKAPVSSAIVTDEALSDATASIAAAIDAIEDDNAFNAVSEVVSEVVAYLAANPSRATLLKAWVASQVKTSTQRKSA
jgi:hypothetical protein